MAILPCLQPIPVAVVTNGHSYLLGKSTDIISKNIVIA